MKFLPNPIDAALKSAKCPECGQITQKRICPNCHKDLPYSIATERQLSIAIVGAKNSGKSHFIAILINELRNYAGTQFGFTVRPLDTKSGTRWEEGMWRPLAVHKRVLNETISADAHAENAEPLVYRLEIRPRDGKKATFVTLSFFDAPGEDLSSTDLLARLSKYVYHADGVILLYDMLDLKNSGETTYGIDRARDILERIVTLYETGRGFSPHKKITASIAITISKLDSLTSVFADKSHAIWNTPRHNGIYDMSDFYVCSATVEQALIQIGAGQIGEFAKMRFGETDTGFFAVSALGAPPIGDRVETLAPIRVAEPMLWLLARAGLIPSTDKR